MSAHAERTTAQVPTDVNSGGAETLPLAATAMFTEDEAARVAAGTPSSTLPILPGYDVVAELGRGGMGVVYKAIQIELKRVVALKMILGGSQAAPADVQRFHIEVEAAARLSHLHIVPIYEVGNHDGQHFFSMKLCDGGSLAQSIRDQQWAAGLADNQKRIAQFMAQVARAVQCAHDQGILHRDLKPANILLDGNGQPHITDFGLAKRVEGGNSLTQTGTVLGTPSYMAPEQAGGKKLTPAADVYSLGAILYEMLTGRTPFTADNPLEILLQVVSAVEPPPPRMLCPTVSRDLETICLKAMAKEPTQRYMAAADLADDLERFANGQSIQAQPASRLLKLRQWSRRNPLIVGAVATLAAVLLIAAGGFALLLPSVRSDGSLDRIQATGKIVVAVDPVYPPMEFLQDGKPVGFDIDLAHRLAERLKVQAEFRVVGWDWSEIPANLAAGKCDMIISSWTITEDRKKDVAFVEYLRIGQVFVCRQGVKVASKNDLAGKVVVVNAGTVAHKYVQSLQQKGLAIKELLVLSTSADPFPTLKKGEADVTITDEPVGRYQASQDAALVVTGSIGHAMDPNPVGIVFRPRDVQLQEAVAEEIRAMRDEGELGVLLGKWFGLNDE